MKTYKMMNTTSLYGFGGSKTDHQGSDDVLTLKTELTNGWNILEATNFLARGNNNEDSGYLITLFHPNKLLTKDFLVNNGADVQTILLDHKVPGLYLAA
jgi:hypothetical protein